MWQILSGEQGRPPGSGGKGPAQLDVRAVPRVIACLSCVPAFRACVRHSVQIVFEGAQE
jgi:hypothetical protein